MLRVNNLKVKYGVIEAVRGISFNVKAGEIVTIIGANGAGKTSTLSAIFNLVKKEGSVKFVDPLCGIEDLKKGIIRVIAEENIKEDPLRILRGYRFFAQGLGELEEKTREYFKKHAKRLILCARERILYELNLILLSERSYETFRMMEEDKVLEEEKAEKPTPPQQKKEEEKKI